MVLECTIQYYSSGHHWFEIWNVVICSPFHWWELEEMLSMDGLDIIYIACSEKNHVFLALCVLVFDHNQWSPTEASLSYGTAGGLTMELVMKWHSWGYSLHWERSSLSYRLKMENMEKSIHIMFPAKWPLWGYTSIPWPMVSHGIPSWYTMVYPMVSDTSISWWFQTAKSGLMLSESFWGQAC